MGGWVCKFSSICCSIEGERWMSGWCVSCTVACACRGEVGEEEEKEEEQEEEEEEEQEEEEEEEEEDIGGWRASNKGFERQTKE